MTLQHTGPSVLREFISVPGTHILTVGGLRLEFLRRGDRWRHRILVQAGTQGEWREILSSEEGSPDQLEPPSPALQDCFLRQVAAETQELQLLGQAGKNVYSAAVRVLDAAREIDFDLCVRAPAADEKPAVLSTYRVSHRGESGKTAGDCNAFRLFSTHGLTEIEVVRPARAEITEPLIQFDPTSGRITIAGCAAEVVSAGPSRRSLRWRYRIRLIASA